MKKKSKPRQVVHDYHHLHPRSRCRLEKSKYDTRNLKYVRRDVHDAFHRLFNNMVPIEMIRHLVNNWCAVGNYTFVDVDVIAMFEGVRYRYRKEDIVEIPTNSFVGRPRGTLLDFDRVFGKHSDVFDACVRVVQEWSPKGNYWCKVVLRATTTLGEQLEYVYHRPRPKRRRR